MKPSNHLVFCCSHRCKDYVIYECMVCGEVIVDSETLKVSGDIIREMYKGE